jgi:hypothetical protein
MTRTALVTLAALAVAGLVAWRLGGTVGAGVIAGFLCGAWIAVSGAAWQMHVARTRPERVMQASGLTFLFKLLALVGFGFVFRFIDAAGERVDWRSFLVTYTAAVLVVMIPGAFDSARALKERRRAAGLVGERGTL